MHLIDSNSSNVCPTQTLVRENYRREGYKYCGALGVYIRVLELDKKARERLKAKPWLQIDILPPQEVKTFESIHRNLVCTDWDLDEKMGPIVRKAIISNQTDLSKASSFLINGKGMLSN